MHDAKRTFWYRFWEIAPAVASLSLLIIPVIASFRFPRATFVFVMIYVLLWFLRSVKSSFFLVYSYVKSKRFAKKNWRAALESLDGRHDKKWTDIKHLVIIATYKEEKEILESTLNALREVDYPLKKIFIVLASEERDRERATANAEYLLKKFKGVFGEMHHIMHPSNIPDEIIGKGANISFAGRSVAEIFRKKGIAPSNVLVTTLDADNRPHPAYFSNLTYHYITQPKRERKCYQPLPFFYNNIWDVPAANRLISLANTFWFLSESGESYHLRNASAHAQSLSALIEMDFWSRRTITEDSHQYWRSYFHFNGDYDVVPLFVPIYQDALQGRTYFTSLVGQYRQLRRWAWAVSDVPYVIQKAWQKRRELPLFKTLDGIWYLWYGQIMWATAPIIILLNKSIPTFLNPGFAGSLFAYNLSYVLNLIFSLMMMGIAVSIWISVVSMPRPRGKHAKLKLLFSLFQWLLLPFIIIIYGAIPALDAQIRLALNKRLAFQVTEKVRSTYA